MIFIKRLIFKILRSAGLDREYIYYSRLIGLKPFCIPALVISVGQACNYKCRDCGNFAPYAPAEFMRCKLDDMKGWLKRIFTSIDSITTIQIQGGEPFLYSDLGELVKFLRNTTEVGGGAKFLI